MRAERFDWDTSRRAIQPGQAPEAPENLLKTLAIILVSLIGGAAIVAGIGYVACLILLAGSQDEERGIPTVWYFDITAQNIVQLGKEEYRINLHHMHSLRKA